MDTTLPRVLIAAVLALSLTACERKAPEASKQAASAPSPLAVQTSPAQPAPSSSGANGDRMVGLPDFTPLMKSQGPVVVNVITTSKSAAQASRSGGDPMEEFFRRFIPDLPPGGQAAPEQGPERVGLGSGFIISPDGYILTNGHVVADSDDVTVRLSDAKREFKAKVVGVDRRTDVALIKVDARDLPTAKLGNSSQVEPGQWVAAIGSPFGFDNTITAGIVSATRRALPDESFVPFIQTDVAVNPGNSGGPLINLKGEVVGINSMIYSRTGGYMGVSFAIPIEVALDVAKQLRATGKVTRGRLGIGIQGLTKELAQSFKLDQPVGAVVTNVEKASPADKAGLKVGDVILSYNGKKIEDPNELPRLVAATKPGDKAALEVWRNGKREQLAATVGEFPTERKTAARQAPPKEAHDTLGLAVSELPPEGRKALAVDYGLVIEDVRGGAAAGSGLERGDVIVAVGHERFRSLEEFNKLLSQRKGQRVPLLVRRGESALFIPVLA
ncbi:MAG TPA: Do family serine endopeptidase [Burkholderiales bacterium]|jgi:serine protease Do